MKTTIINAIDWLSVKLAGISLPFLLISWNALLAWLGAAVMISTLIYNGIRIYKELKQGNEKNT